jgi:putative membrane protein
MKIRSRWLWIATALVGVLVAASAFAQTTGMRPDDWRGGWGWGWGHMVFGSLMMLLFWGAVVLAIVFVVRWLGMAGHRPETPAPENRALAILEERFARGEIDVNEFEERKRRLSN